jgi:diguanylate cyclase (GGDEF)-like protein
MNAPAAPNVNHNNNTKNILVVDDSRTQVELLKYLLELQGYAVTTAANGREALDAARDEPPALVLSDIVMPVMDGYEMCAQIKADEQLHHVPVILLTQLAETEDIVRGLHARADYYLTKPYRPEYLLSKVKAVLENPPARGDKTKLQDDLAISLDGKDYVVNADRQQMMNLLFSTYENAVQQNRELINTQLELKAANERLTEQMNLLHEAREELEGKQTELMRVNEKLESLAVTDGLTGLKNHRAFKEKLEEYFRYGARYGSSPLSLVMLDVDHFKSYNDSFGHPDGDEVLQLLARVMQENVRQADFVARYGGEEFAVVMPHTDREEAEVSAERLRSAIENTAWPDRPITASLGVATTIPDRKELDSAALISSADKALYVSKQNGRNRTTHADNM